MGIGKNKYETDKNGSFAMSVAEYVGPIPTNVRKEDIFTFAEKAAEDLEFGTDEHIATFVSSIGGKIKYKNPEDSEKSPESIVVRSLGDFDIFIPTITSEARNRFTIAHELGHYFLHYPIVTKQKPGAKMLATRWVNEVDGGLQRAEWEANWFAAAFLMPSKKFKERHIKENGVISRVAAYFSVSENAARMRAVALGL